MVTLVLRETIAVLVAPLLVVVNLIVMIVVAGLPIVVVVGLLVVVAVGHPTIIVDDLFVVVGLLILVVQLLRMVPGHQALSSVPDLLVLIPLLRWYFHLGIDQYSATFLRHLNHFGLS